MSQNKRPSRKVQLDTDQLAFAKEVAKQLGETDQVPKRQIQLLIGKLGIEFVQQVLDETFVVEANGGMMVADRARKRTVGGVFFQVAREKLPQEQRDIIFFNWRVALRQHYESEAKRLPFTWKERKAIIAPLLENQGEVRDVKITLLGQPGAIERRKNLVITTLIEQRIEVPAMPSGVPPLPTDPTTYVVYISSKQWERVEDHVGNAEDPMLIEGFCAYDSEVNGVTIYATYVSTKKLDQREKKQARSAAKQAAMKSQTKKEPQPNGEKPAAEKPVAEKSADKAPDKPDNKPKKQPPVAAVAPVAPVFTIPDNVPPAVAQKLTDLYTAAAMFRQKIALLEAKPTSQQAGLDMTQKLLKNTEKQIETLEKQYANN